MTNKKILFFLFTALFLIGGFVASGVSAVPAANADSVEILIGFEDSPNSATYNLIRAQGWEITGELSQINVLVVTVPDLPELPGKAADRARQALEEAFDKVSGIVGVSFVEENGLMYAHSQTIPWGIDRIGAVEAHSISTGTEVGIAILDTGIDVRHEDLVVAGGYAVVNCRPRPQCATAWDDDHGHGTHVAGTAAALDNNLGVLGVAPALDLYAVKVLDRQGAGTWAGVAKGIIWAADQGIEVLNMSLGGGHSDTVQSAVVYAYNKGSLLVASAGNSGPDEDTVGYPAAYAEVIAVSATGQDDNIASWSSRGKEVELAAPGVSIYSTLPGNSYGTYSGTSMSAPHVAGTAALAWATNLKLTNVEVRGILQSSAENIGLTTTQQGYGLVNAAAAVGVEVTRVAISPSIQEGEAWPGNDVVYEFTIENAGDTEDTYNVSVNSEWISSVDPISVILGAGENTTVSVIHSVPEGASAGDTDTGIIEAVSLDTGAAASAKFITNARGYAVEITPESQESSGAPGDTVEYVYTVSNTGTEDGSYNLEITDTIWEASVSTSSVTLSAGESVDVTVSHTISGDAGDSDFDTGTLTAVFQADNTVYASATFTTIAKIVTEATTVSVVSIDYTTRGGRLDDKHLDIAVTLEDNLGSLVANASISITLSRDDGSSWNFEGTTGSNGTVIFSLVNHGSGCYETKVTVVEVENLEWDGITPENSYCK